MKHLFITIFFVCICGNTIFSQIEENRSTTDKLIERANLHFYNYEYKQAYGFYLRSIQKEDQQPDVMVKLAQCCSRLNKTVEAEEWYSKAIKTGVVLKAEYILNFVTVLISNGKFDDAKKWIDIYNQKEQNDIRAKNYLGTIENINDYFKDSTFYLVENFGLINSKESEISPVVFNDKIFFSSRRNFTPEFNNDVFYDIYFTDYKDGVAGSSIKSVSKAINTRNHEGPIAINSEKKSLYYTRNIPDSTDLNKSILGIFEVSLDSLQKSQGKQIRIDGFDYSIGHPSLNKKGDVLYFISDADKGIGGVDIYRSRWVNKKWSYPENLGSRVNTKGDEMFPFIYNDSILYFSSNGQGGLGGLDIYKVNLNDSNSQVVNLGYPINSNADDFGITINKDEHSGFLVSNRTGGYGSDDIYKLHILKVLIKGSLSDAYSKEFIEEATIVIQTDNQNDIVVKSDSTGQFEFEITVGTPYRLLIKKENYQPQELLLNKNPDLVKNEDVDLEINKDELTELVLDSGTYVLKIPEITNENKNCEQSVIVKYESPKEEKIGFYFGDRINFNLIPQNEEDTSVVLINRQPIKRLKGKPISFSYDAKINIECLKKCSLKKIPISTFKDSVTAVTYSDVISSILTTSLVNSEFIIIPQQDVDLRYGTESYINSDMLEDSVLDLMSLEDLLKVRIPLILKKGKKYHISSEFNNGRLLDVITAKESEELIKFTSSKLTEYNGDSLRWLLNGKTLSCLSSEKLGFVLRPNLVKEIKIIEEIGDTTQVPLSDIKKTLATVVCNGNVKKIEDVSIENNEFSLLPDKDIILNYSKSSDIDSTLEEISVFGFHDPKEDKEPIVLKSGVKYIISTNNAEGKILESIDVTNGDVLKFCSMLSGALGKDSLISCMVNGKNVSFSGYEQLLFGLKNISSTLYIKEINGKEISDNSLVTESSDSTNVINIAGENVEKNHVPCSDIKNSLSTVVYKDEIKKVENISIKNSEFEIVPQQDVDFRIGTEVYQSDTIDDSKLELMSLEELMNIRIPLTLYKGKKYHLSTEFTKGRLLEVISAKDTSDLIKFTSGKLIDYKGDSISWLINGQSVTSLADERIGFVLYPNSSKQINVIEEIEDTTLVPLSDINKTLTTVVSNGNVKKIEDISLENSEFSLIPDNDIILNYSKSSGIDSSLEEISVFGFHDPKEDKEPIVLKSGVKYIISTNNAEGKILDSIDVTKGDVLKFCSMLSGALGKDNVISCMINGKNVSFSGYEQLLFGLKNISSTLYIKEINGKEFSDTIISGESLDFGTQNQLNQNKDIHYRIQIAAARRPMLLSELKKLYKGEKPMKMFQEEGYYKYYIDESPTYFEAKQIMSDSNVDGFIVAYVNDKEKTTIQKAMKTQYMEQMANKGATIKDSIINIVTVNFAFDDYRLAPKDVGYIQDLVIDKIMENCDYYVVVNGHTDVRGSNTYNFGLSEERAEFVKKELIKMGIPDGRIRTYSYGESMLLKTCNDHEDCGEEVNMVNRRVEIIVFSPKN